MAGPRILRVNMGKYQKEQSKGASGGSSCTCIACIASISMSLGLPEIHPGSRLTTSCASGSSSTSAGKNSSETKRKRNERRPRNGRGGSAQLPDAFGKAVEDFPSVPAAAGLCPICLDELDDGEVPGAAVTGRLTKLRCRHGTGQVTKRRRKKAEV